MQPLWKSVWRFLRKLKRELPYDLATPLLGTHLDKTLIQNDAGTPMLIGALVTILKTQKQSKCPLTDEYLKTWDIYTTEYCSVIKKKIK